MFRPPFRPVLVVAAVTATALLGACSDDTAAPGPTADATTTTSTAAPTTTTEPSAPTTPEDEVAAAYVAVMARYFEHLGDPDPGATSFEGHTGAHLEFVVEMHHQFARDHVVAAPGLSGAWPIPSVVESSVQGDTATLTVCLVDDSRVLEASSGQVVNDHVSSKLSIATLIRAEGSWLLTNQKLLAQWEDVAGCDR